MEIKDIDKYKSILVGILQEFVDFCNKNKLNYFLSSGSLLGAVRNNGIIPWDDDIDIAMPLDDYYKFISLYESCYNNRFEVIYPKIDNNYNLPFAKFCSKTTTLIETKGDKLVYGLYIDIFPLIEYPSDEKEQMKMLIETEKIKDLMLTLHKNDKLKLFRAIYHLQYRKIYYILRKKAGRKYIINRISQLQQKCKNSSYLDLFGGFYFMKEVFPKQWFESSIEIGFESLNVKIPKEYDKILTKMYGDYMQLPPVEERKSHHSVIYYNLNRQINYEEYYNLYDCP